MGKNGRKANRRTDKVTFEWLPGTCHMDRNTNTNKMQTSQELRMLSSVTINSQITKIVMNSGSQWSEL